MIGGLVQFQKWACVKTWKDTVPKLAWMTKVYLLTYWDMCLRLYKPVLKMSRIRKV